MSWFRVDDRFSTSRKVARLPRQHRLKAIGLWTIAGAWSSSEETDGFVPSYMIEELGGTQALARMLVEAGLWTKSEGKGGATGEQQGSNRGATGEQGYSFHEWATYNPTREELTRKREADAERKRQARKLGAERAAAARRPDGVRADTERTPDGIRAASGMESVLPDPTRPDPLTEAKASVGGATRPPRPRATQLPADFAVTDAMKEWARTVHNVYDVGPETAKFEDYCRANGKTYKDWAAAWRNWIARSTQYAGGRPAPVKAAHHPAIEDWMLR